MTSSHVFILNFKLSKFSCILINNTFLEIRFSSIVNTSLNPGRKIDTVLTRIKRPPGDVIRVKFPRFWDRSDDESGRS